MLEMYFVNSDRSVLHLRHVAASSGNSSRHIGQVIIADRLQKKLTTEGTENTEKRRGEVASSVVASTSSLLFFSVPSVVNLLLFSQQVDIVEQRRLQFPARRVHRRLVA